MDQDYLLIGVDPARQISIRFLSLSHVLTACEKIHADLPQNLKTIYRDFVALCSRKWLQQGILGASQERDFTITLLNNNEDMMPRLEY